MVTKKNESKPSKLSKWIKAPLRILVKARDFYVKSMNEYSNQIGHGSVMGCPTGQVANTLPKSFSVNSTKSRTTYDEDYRELLRAASTRALRSNRVEQKSTKSNNNMPRSYSVGIGRIDEEKPCDDIHEEINVKLEVFPRSRSYAVSRRTMYK